MPGRSSRYGVSLRRRAFASTDGARLLAARCRARRGDRAHRSPSSTVSTPASASWLGVEGEPVVAGPGDGDVGRPGGRGGVPSFCWTTVSSWPHGIRTRYCVATPMKDASVTTPLDAVEVAGGCLRRVDHGASPAARRARRPSHRRHATARSARRWSPCTSTTSTVAAGGAGDRGTRPGWTGRGSWRRTSCAGARRASAGSPICSIRPAFMTAMVSAIVMASSWSWVTCTNVRPTSVWIRLSSICIWRRSLRSSAPSGSSSRSTPGGSRWRGRARPAAAGRRRAGAACAGPGAASSIELEDVVDLLLDGPWTRAAAARRRRSRRRPCAGTARSSGTPC